MITTINVDRKTWARFKQEATEKGVSASGLLSRVISEHLGEKPPEAAKSHRPTIESAPLPDSENKDLEKDLKVAGNSRFRG